MKKFRQKERKAAAAEATPAKNFAVAGQGVMLDPSIHVAILIAACFITYWTSMSVPFTFDDSMYILENPLIRNFSSFRGTHDLDLRIVNKDVIYNFALRPVAYFTFALNYMMTGYSPGEMHLFNILIHTASAVLVYAFSRTLLTTAGTQISGNLDSRSVHFIPFFTAMLFAVHPIQTQAVTYIVQRFTSLVALLYILSLLLYLLYRSLSDKRARFASYLFALAATVAAMKTKENAFTLPLVILMVELLFFRGELKKRLAFLVPFFLTMAVIPLTVARLSAAGNGSDLIDKGANLVNYGGYATGDYLVTQIRVLVTYLRLLIFPVNQNLDYDFPLFHDPLDYRILLSMTLLLMLAGTALLLLRHSWAPSCRDPLRVRLISFGILWFFVTLSIESSFIPLQDLIVEHRLYLPSFGAILATVAGVDWLRSSPLRKTWLSSAKATVILAVVAIIFSGATIKRNYQWQNIWQDVIAKSPNKARAYHNLGAYHLKSSRYEEAEGWFRQSIAKQHEFPGVHVNLGICLLEQKKYAEALEELNMALKNEPENFVALEAIGTVHLRTGDFRNAAVRFRECLALNPDYGPAKTGLQQAQAKLEAS